MIVRRIRATGRFFLVALGVIAVLTEEFLWSWTGQMMAALGRWEPVARCERVIARLPPYPALVLLVLPWAIILPVKLIALYYIACGQIIRGVLLFTAGEIVGVAILARFYAICRPSLLRLVWFSGVERFVVGCTNWAHRLLENVPAYRQARRLVTRVTTGGFDRLHRWWDGTRREADARRRPSTRGY